MKKQKLGNEINYARYALYGFHAVSNPYQLKINLN